jgi:hypothetical protein
MEMNLALLLTKFAQKINSEVEEYNGLTGYCAGLERAKEILIEVYEEIYGKISI